MPPSIQRIEDLRPTHITLLTQLLYLPPRARISSNWLRDQRHLINRFPSSLQRPTSILSRAILALPLYISGRAQLCRAHKGLNSFLVRQIFLHVSAECTTRLQGLTAPNVRSSLPPDLKKWLRRLERLNSLWTNPELYRTAYHAMPDEPRKEFVKSGCEACILARVGGDVQAVIDLRASCLGRTRKRRQKPRLLGIIDGWIGWSGERERVEEESSSISREIKEIRRELQKERRKRTEERRKRRKNGRTGSDRSRRHSPAVPESERGRQAPHDHDSWNEQDVGEPEDDFENRIISHYRNLVSTTSLDVQIGSHAHEEHLHPAFHESIIFSPEDGTFYRQQPASISEMDGASDPRPSARDHRHAERTSGAYGSRPYTAPIRPQAPSPHAQEHQTTYTQSIYSHDCDAGLERSSSRHRAASPERATHRAAAYRRLVGGPEPTEAHSGGAERRQRSADRARSPSRSWSRRILGSFRSGWRRGGG